MSASVAAGAVGLWGAAQVGAAKGHDDVPFHGDTAKRPHGDARCEGAAGGGQGVERRRRVGVGVIGSVPGGPARRTGRRTSRATIRACGGSSTKSDGAGSKRSSGEARKRFSTGKRTPARPTGSFRRSAYVTPYPVYPVTASTPEPEGGAQCVSSAGWDLCGGGEQSPSLPRPSALPKEVENWPLTTLREKLIMIWA
jgi:hypothetical protein